MRGKRRRVQMEAKNHKLLILSTTFIYIEFMSKNKKIKIKNISCKVFTNHINQRQTNCKTV